MPRTRTPLSAKERLFVQHYLGGLPGIRGNATQASLAAGYAPKAARSSASVLLRKPRIEAAIEAHFAKADITVARVLEELRRIAFSDLRQVATWGGADGVRLLTSDTLTDEAAACIAEVVDHSKTVGQDILDRQVRVKLHDKLAALNTLAKYLGMLREPEAAKERPLFPKGFFAALITGDPSKLEEA
jgi:phage terminase small subunit